jgi:glycerol-3-phosphate responsive antiterminator
MSSYGSQKKQICFESTAKLHADLKICLHHDEIKIKDFFNEIVSSYVSKDKNVAAFIETLKEKKGISQTRQKKLKEGRIKQEGITRQFALNKNDIENIFDILEKEHPDL